MLSSHSTGECIQFQETYTVDAKPYANDEIQTAAKPHLTTARYDAKADTRTKQDQTLLERFEFVF